MWKRVGRKEERVERAQQTWQGGMNTEDGMSAGRRDRGLVTEGLQPSAGLGVSVWVCLLGGGV